MIDRRTRQLALAADVGGALTRGEDLRPMLTQCAQALVEHLDAAFARIWTLPDGGDVLELQASAGMYTHIDGPHGRVPVGKFKIGRIAANGAPHLSNDVQHDPEVGDHAWAKREGMVAFAGYPLLVGDRVIGVLAMFAREALPDDTLHLIASIADLVALGIHRKRVEAQRERLHRERDAAVRALEAERQQFYELLLQAPGAVAYLSGPDHRFVLANEAYEGIAGRPVVGKTIREAFPELAEHPLFDMLDGVRTTGVPVSGKEVAATLVRNGQPEEAFFDFTYQAWRKPDGDPDGVLIHAFEVTGQVLARRAVENVAVELERRVAERTSELLEVNRELEAFSYTVSHDLRAPIRHVAGFVDLLKRHLGPSADDKTLRHLKTISEAARQMGALIDGLLGFSRLGRVELALAPVDTAALVRSVIEELAPDLQGRTIEWDIGELPAVRADATLLRVVWTNLLSNAAKYTAQTTIARVTITAAPHVPDPGESAGILFTVADNGIGFDMAWSGKLFGVFQRLHAAEDFPGTGVGLATVRRIVKRHGGRIWAHAVPDQGATFSFTLPAAERGT